MSNEVLDPDGVMKEWLALKAEVEKYAGRVTEGAKEYHRWCLKQIRPTMVKCPGCGAYHAFRYTVIFDDNGQPVANEGGIRGPIEDGK